MQSQSTSSRSPVVEWERDCGRMRRVENEARSLHQMPLIIILQICDSLGQEDVLALSRTNKFLHSLLSSCFVFTVELSVNFHLNVINSKKRVLRLCFSCNLHNLPGIDKFEPMNSLNLSKLKDLCLTGNNHIWKKQYLLSEQYKHTLEFLLTTLDRVSIQRLEFLTDETHSFVSLLDSLHTFINLSEVILHGISYFNPCASYHMDKEIAQNIINQVLRNKRLKILRLKSFQTINRCVFFESESLELLEAELGKSFEIGLLNLPSTKVIRMDTSMWYGCFYHAQNGELKNIVNHGCPRLQRFNGIDLECLAERSEDGHWLEQLKEYSLRQMETEGECVLCSEHVEL